MTRPEGEPVGPAWTFWVEGPRRRARIVLRGSFFVVGRLEPFAVFQDDPMISRDHAVIVAVEGGVRVRDMGSRNGVLLDGKRLERYTEVDLPAGAVLHVGQTAIRLLREGERPDALAGRAAERAGEDDVTVDEEGQTKGRLAAVDVAALTSSSDDAGEATGELDVPELVDEDEVEAVAAAVRDAARPRSAAEEDVLDTRRLDGSEEPAGIDALPVAAEPAVPALDAPEAANRQEPGREPSGAATPEVEPPRDEAERALE